MRIVHVLPRNMRFDCDRATSIDLCVSELATASAHARWTTVLAEAGASPLPAPSLVPLPHRRVAGTALRVLDIAAALRRIKAHVIVVQQHLPSAAGVALLSGGTPVILQTHNLPRRLPPGPGLRRALQRRRRLAMLRMLSGITFVSETSAALFRESWPEADLPFAVVQNGYQPDSWCPRQSRDKMVLCVGRAAPEKGLLEAAHATAAVLLGHPDWTATFVVSEGEASPGRVEAIARALKPLAWRARLLLDRPFTEIRALNERAAIALVPSKWQEPFGRTALEAHAGGAALISSGTGGLREVSGARGAVYLPDVSVSTIAHALDRLIQDPVGRQALALSGQEHAAATYSVRAVAGRLDQFCSRVQALSMPRGVLAQAVRGS